MYNEEISKQVAKYLLEIKAIKLNPNNPYTWTSGIKSPIYCDNRLILSFPEIRTFIKNSFAKLVQDKFPNVEYVMGIATAGIAHAALIADQLNLPTGYVRSKPKEHGTQSAIEGFIKENGKVLLIEDLISTGGSIINATSYIRKENFKLEGALSIFTYNLFNSDEILKQNDINTYYLCNFASVLKVASEKSYISEKELKLIEEWMLHPS